MELAERAAGLRAHALEATGCERCGLAESRARVVYGMGRVDAELMLVGEAPGFLEEQQGIPFAGQAAELLERLLASIGLGRDDVYLANVLNCRPPQNRDPRDEEIAACEPLLFRQISFVRPRVVATLGNVATKLLSARPHGITRVHGQEHEVTIGGHSCLLFPLYHPAAALYTPSMLRVLEHDVERLGELLGRWNVAPVPAQPTREPELSPVTRAPAQLGLF
ncbi:MAG: uracil-DNA glycosylase [Gaiella sp.]